MYGSVGGDTVAGGSGNDLLDGGDRKTATADDGVDTADYSIGDNDAAQSSGISLVLGESGVVLDGAKGILATDDGYGSSDRLFSIEKVKGTSKSDSVTIKSTDLSGYALTGNQLEIDAGGNDTGRGDVLDFSAMGAGINVTLAADHGLAINAITLKNFETFIATSFDDTMSAGEGDQQFYGGAAARTHPPSFRGGP